MFADERGQIFLNGPMSFTRGGTRANVKHKITHSTLEVCQRTRCSAASYPKLARDTAIGVAH